MRRMKFFVARRKFQVMIESKSSSQSFSLDVFQEARKPSDMTELVKQTAEDNQALMIKLKDLHRK